MTDDINQYSQSQMQLCTAVLVTCVGFPTGLDRIAIKVKFEVIRISCKSILKFIPDVNMIWF